MSGILGRLYVVPSLLGQVSPDKVLPAGTLQVIRALSDFVVETPKIARQFLRLAGHPRPLGELRMRRLDEHTPEADVPALLAPALAGNDLGLLSDAGCPGIADPGARLVASAHLRGIRVVPLVGPSAILLALMASGLDGQRFAFHGYLPAQSAARDEALRRLERDAAASGHTQLFIETPYRNVGVLESARRVLQPETWLCVAADLTTDNEEVARLRASQWTLEDLSRFHRRPAMFLIGCD